jgi:hypothetical protein
MIVVVSNASSTTHLHHRHQPSTPETAWLRFDRSVARDLVHRKALAEVLIADTVQVDDDEFLVGTQLPRAHTLWSDRRYSYHDPLITVEICRQACLALPQRYYDVGGDWQFISKRIDFSVVNLYAFTDTELAPPEGVLRARFSNKRQHHGELCGITVESELTIDGISAGTVNGDLMFFPKITFESMRAQQLRDKGLDGARLPSIPRPVDCARVGRVFDRNVAIGDSARDRSAAGEHRYAVIVDQTHPCFFDHPADHVPGALVMEIYRQAAIATATDADAATPGAAIIIGSNVHLNDFAELNALTECSATVTAAADDGATQIELALHQLDTQIGNAQVELHFVSFAGQA